MHDWLDVRSVLMEAVDHPPEERAALLERLCAHDPALLEEARAYLDEYDESFLEAPPLDEDLPRAFGRFRLLARLGSGGSGDVFRAETLEDSHAFAVKILASELSLVPGLRQRVAREAEAAMSLAHPNIVRVFSLESIDGREALVKELVDGRTLREELGLGPAPVERALDWARQIAAGLEHAHGTGVIHRDLKPANIIITSEAGVAKILDFGIAKLVATERAERLTATGDVLGTASYMSPEQSRGDRDIDARTDIFAFGCVLYEMLSGRKAFPGDTVAATAGVLHGEPRPLENAPEKLVGIVQRALRKAPGERFQSARELRRALE